VEVAKTPRGSMGLFWRQKYKPNIEEANLIRWNDQIKGSSIWNAAWQNQSLIQEHAFWELRSGQNALFWSDSWQQMPPLRQNDSLQNIQTLMLNND
jgi:hypothetical protein